MFVEQLCGMGPVSHAPSPFNVHNNQMRWGYWAHLTDEGMKSRMPLIKKKIGQLVSYDQGPTLGLTVTH